MATRRYNTRSRARNTPPVVPTPEATPGPGAGAGTRRRGSGSSRTAKRSLKLGSASMPTVPDVSNAKEDDIIALARAARNLVDDGLVPSAVRVAAMAVNALDDFAAASGAALAARTRAAVTLVYADALHKQKQLLYAKSMFEGALELLGGAASSGNASRDDTPTSRVESGTPARIPAAKLARRSSSRDGTDEVDSVGGLPLLPRNEILFRIARIQLEMDQADGAWATMTRVPFEERTAAMHSTVGYLAIQEGQPVSVIVRAFQSVLRLNPYAVEAMDILARYRPSDSEASGFTPTAIEAPQHGQWLQQLYRAKNLSAQCKHQDAVEAYRSLETSLCPAKGECIETKVGVACGLSAQGMYTAAIASFSEVHRVWPLWVGSMAEFARVVSHLTRSFFEGKTADQDSVGDLSAYRIANDLLRACEQLPDGWVAAARAALDDEDVDTAARFLDTALRLCPGHPLAELVRAEQLESAAMVTEAVAQYRKAISVQPSFTAYQGACDLLLKSDSVSAAQRQAKKLVQLMPNDARCLVVLGQTVNAQDPPRAFRLYVKALEMDPRCVQALVAAVSLLVAHDNGEKALRFIDKRGSSFPEPFVQCAMAEVYVHMKDYALAMNHYHLVLQRRPKYVPALEGLDMVQELIAAGETNEEEDSTMQD